MKGSAAGHRADDQEWLVAPQYRGRQRVVRGVVREVLAVGVEAHERSAPARRRVRVRNGVGTLQLIGDLAGYMIG